jgi:hypothetical protein
MVDLLFSEAARTTDQLKNTTSRSITLMLSKILMTNPPASDEKCCCAYVQSFFDGGIALNQGGSL